MGFLRRHGIRAAMALSAVAAGTLPHFVLPPTTIAGYAAAVFALLAVFGLALTLLIRGELPDEWGLTGVKWKKQLRETTDEVGRQAEAQQGELEAIGARLANLDVMARAITALGTQVDLLYEEMTDLGQQVEQLTDLATKP